MTNGALELEGLYWKVCVGPDWDRTCPKARALALHVRVKVGFDVNLLPVDSHSVLPVQRHEGCFVSPPD